jgi:hypothetical protein
MINNEVYIGFKQWNVKDEALWFCRTIKIIDQPASNRTISIPTYFLFQLSAYHKERQTKNLVP